MINLIRMDLYRMRKSKGFWVCLILTFLFAFVETPAAKALADFAVRVAEEAELGTVETLKTADLSSIIAIPFPLISGLLVLLSAAGFFYADAENGYIKNIAGQMPKRGYTVLSKFLAILPHNLLFMLVCIVGNLLGTMSVLTIVPDAAILTAVGHFALKLLILQGLCSILLLICAGFQNKPLGTVLAVLLGLGLLSLVYLGIDAGLNQIFPKKNFAVSDYMPEQMLRLGVKAFKPLRAAASSAVCIGVFLPLAIRVFDRIDVK